MKAEELRIGNLFIEKYSKDIMRVIELTEANIVFDGIQLGKWQAEPILLTEEWLVKLGFTCLDFIHDGIEDNGYHEPKKDFSLDRNFQFDEYYKTIDLEYVHQLQNLYFVLTGEELEFKK